MLKDDSIRGCLILGAIGDALGSATEGATAESSRDLRLVPITDDQITDDTQLTLATCESIVKAGKVLPEHIAATFAAWHRLRIFRGLGSSTFKALTDLVAGQHWALSGARGERAAGNGAAMRVAPLAFCLDPCSSNDRRTIRDVCRITHHHDEAYIGALAIAVAIHSAANQTVPLGDIPSYVQKRFPTR